MPVFLTAVTSIHNYGMLRELRQLKLTGSISFMVVMQIFSPSLLPSHVRGRSIVIFSIELDFAIGLALDS